MIRNFISSTVFAPLEENAPSDKILAVLFHRSAATIYALYFAWGVVSVFGIIPTILFQQGSLFQDVYSLAIIICSVIACIGATFFPRTGRTELYGGLAMIGLITFYIGSLVAAVVAGDELKLSGAVFGATHLVVPIARSVFIYLTLIKHSDGKSA